MMDPSIKVSTPCTALTIAMEDLVEREVFPLQLASNSKGACWDLPKESTSIGGLRHDSFVSAMKRKRSVTFDPRESSSQEESDIVLALGRSAKSSHGVPPAVGSSSLRKSLQLSGGSCRGELDILSLSRTSPAHGLRNEIASESDLSLCLGNKIHDGESRDGCNFSGSTTKALQDDLSEVPLDLGLCMNPTQANSIAESSSFLSLRDAIERAGALRGLRPTESPPGFPHDPLSQHLQIPIVDEGSSSARWIKSGGFMPSFLKSNQEVQKIGAFDYSESNWVAADHQEELGEADLSISVRPYSSSTTITEASALRDRSFKICKFEGCVKGARGTSGLCIAHGGGRRCQKHGCSKGAEGRTVYCKAHGGGRRCETLGCTKSAEGKTDYCIGHGGGRRCGQEGCVKAARGRSGLCIRHGGGKRCKKDGCTKSAEGYTGLCISHGGGRRCQFGGGCTKGAQGSTKFCKAHGGGKRCMILGCNKGAEGSTPLCKGHGGGKRCMFEGGGICTKSVHGGTAFCVAHGGGKRCAVPNCSKSARGRTDFCVRHGGGKRCKFQGCDKSAQGSTDFCKAHGGGKRCTWGQEAAGYGLEGSGGFSKTRCDRFARGRLGLCAAHSALVQDQRVHGLDHAVAYALEGSGTEGSECAMDLELRNEMLKGSNASTLMNEQSWSARVGSASEGQEIGLGKTLDQTNISDQQCSDVLLPVHGAEIYLRGPRSSSVFTFRQAAAPGGLVSSSSNAPDTVASQIVPCASTVLVQSLPPSVVHPRALRPQCYRARSSPLNSVQFHASSTPFAVNNHPIASSLAPEGSVHGGGFLAFLTSESAKKDRA